MITGVWLSPDGEAVAVQVDEDAIVVVDAAGERTAGEVPLSWSTLHDATE